MRNLDDIRREIIENDKQLAQLFEHRMNLSKEVADYKASNALSVFDAKREQEVIDNFLVSLCNKSLSKWATRLICELMNSSKEYQRTFLDTLAPTVYDNCTDTVVCQGTLGAYGEEAAISYFGVDAKIECLQSFDDVFMAVSNGKARFGIVPIENSSTGAIGDVYDLFGQYGCSIAGEYILKINHNLLANDDASLDTIYDIYSHTQGFEQCTGFLKKHPDLNLVPYHNTAVSAKYVSECADISKAAIASKRAAQIYNLKILAENINNNYNNYTRFVIITKDAVANENADKVSVMFRLEHKRGRLCTLMEHFSRYDINLLKIESRPIANKNWEYNFFIDFAANLNDIDMRALIDSLSKCSESFKLLGNYKSANI